MVILQILYPGLLADHNNGPPPKIPLNYYTVINEAMSQIYWESLNKTDDFSRIILLYS
jgi:hypothetical protein